MWAPRPLPGSEMDVFMGVTAQTPLKEQWSSHFEDEETEAAVKCLEPHSWCAMGRARTLF